MTYNEFVTEIIEKAISKYGNVRKTAMALGIQQGTLWRMYNGQYRYTPRVETIKKYFSMFSSVRNLKRGDEKRTDLMINEKDLMINEKEINYLKKEIERLGYELEKLGYELKFCIRKKM